MTPSNANRRAESLAVMFQEVLTAIERLRGNRQGVTDAEAFRHHTREALRNAAAQAMQAGYNADDTRYCTFACVAFLDESILNSQNPIFADWLRKPMQEELFGTHIAGETFFQNLQGLLGASDSPDLADVLEVHYLCLTLGFCGRFSAGDRSGLTQIMGMTSQKIPSHPPRRGPSRFVRRPGRRRPKSRAQGRGPLGEEDGDRGDRMRSAHGDSLHRL